MSAIDSDYLNFIDLIDKLKMEMEIEDEDILMESIDFVDYWAYLKTVRLVRLCTLLIYTVVKNACKQFEIKMHLSNQ